VVPERNSAGSGALLRSERRDNCFFAGSIRNVCRATLASCLIDTFLLDQVIGEQVSSRGFKVILHLSSSLIGLDASHGCLQPGMVAWDGVQQVANSTVFVGKLVCHRLGSSLHQHKGIAMLSNEPLEAKIALAFLPLSCVEKLLVPLDLRFPSAIVSILVGQGKPGIPPIFALLKRFDRSSVRCGPSGLLKLVVDHRVIFPE